MLGKRLLCAVVFIRFICSCNFTFAADDANPISGVVQDKITLISCANSTSRIYAGYEVLRIQFCESARNYSPSRSLKLAGKRIEGMKISPAIKGEWRFEGDYVLSFKPSVAWQANQSYTVTFADNLYPQLVNLSTSQHAFKTAPLHLISKTMNYLQDPLDPVKKLVTAQLAFNYPVNREKLSKGLLFTLEGNSASQAFSVMFDHQDMQANVSIPVAQLEENTQFMIMAANTVVVTADGSGSLTTQSNVTSALTQRVLIPSLLDYLQVTQTSTQVLKNSHYIPQQILAIETNAAVDPSELAQFVDIRLLPKDKPVLNFSVKKNYPWQAPAEVSADLRATLMAIPFDVLKGAEPGLLNSVNYAAEANRFLLVTLKKGLPALGGYRLGKDYETIVQAPALPHEVKVMAQGGLLSLSGEKSLSILSLGVKKITYDIGRVKEANLAHLISQSSGDFSNPQFADAYSFNENNISEKFREVRVLEQVDAKRPNYSSFDFSPYIQASRGLYFLTVRGQIARDDLTDRAKASNTAAPDKNGEAVSAEDGHGAADGDDKEVAEVQDRRFILITDLGLIVKKNSDASWDVFVQSVADGGPVSRVTVQVLGVNGEVVAEARTDSDGHASLPNLTAMQNEKRPVAFVARKDSDLSFLPFGREDRQLNYAKFEVDGNLPSEGMQAYLFNDRGIYRPGETAHVGIIVKARDWYKNVAGLPLVFEITNPRGQVVSKQNLALTAEGLMSADFTVSERAQTGAYNAALYLGRGNQHKGSLLGTAVLRIEEFMPDRMKMTSAVLQKENAVDGLAWLKPEQLSVNISLMHLYGAPAVNRRVTAKLDVAPGAFGFQSFKEYSFSAENNVSQAFEKILNETVTDVEGNARFELDLAQYGQSTYRLNFFGEGFEPDSGRSVKTAKSVLISPLDYVVGTKSNGNLNYINPNDKRTLSLIAVNASLAKIDVKNLSVELKRSKEVQTLTKNNAGNYEYRSARIETALKKDALHIPASGLNYVLPTANPGSYVLLIRNAQDVVLARQLFTVVGESNAAGDATRDATMQLTLDKSAYAADEEITLNIQSPYAGTGLITIETDKVHAWQWFATSTTSSVQKIAIPSGFEGKGYVNVQFTRDLKSKEIFMSPLSFAVAPFTANIATRDQRVTLSVPTEVQPGDAITVKYRSKDTGKIMLFAVDEGILQYAQYKNPDPLEFFLMKRALEVQTSQIMDLILPEYALLKSFSAVGGDGFANDGKNLNPFKRKTQPPVAYWSGILATDANTKDWTFTVPSYFNGKVRIIAVSTAVNAVGVATADVTVRGPLIVTPNLPLFVAPGDEFFATATVVNQIKGSGAQAKVQLNIDVSPQLKLLDEPKPLLVLAEGEETTVQLHLKATQVLGSGEIMLAASGVGPSAQAQFDISQTLSVRPPLTAMTQLSSGYVKDTTKTLPLTRVLYPQFAQTKAAVSSLPVSLIGGLTEYLTQYPYGCTEQLTSQNFPNVLLYGNAELMQAFGWQAAKMENALQVSFDQLRERQSYNGGWGMWNYYSQPDGFVSAYTLHFLILAREKNLPVPQDVYDAGLRYLKSSVNEAPVSLENAREKMYGLYLLTRAGEITTNFLPHLINYLESYHAKIWQDDLVAVYLAATYQQMQMQPEADALLAKFNLAEPVRYSDAQHAYGFYDSLTKYAQYIYLLAEHFPAQLQKMDKAVIWRVANFVGEGSFNTVSSAYAVMAIDAYVRAQQDALSDVAISAQDANGKQLLLEVLGQQLKVASLPFAAAQLSFTSASPSFFYQIATTGYDQLLPTTALTQGLELTRSYVTEEGKVVAELDKAASSVKLGDVLTVKFTLRSGNNKVVPNVALVDLLPGGFELEPEAQNAVPAPEASVVDAAGDSITHWLPQSVDRREDRLIAYGQFPAQASVYQYRIKATSRGSFVTPPVYAESMYDAAIKVRGLAGRIEVQ